MTAWPDFRENHAAFRKFGCTQFPTKMPEKTLLLARHAETQGAGFGQADPARALTQRGIFTAVRAGEWLKAQGHRPDFIYASAAVRTSTTAELIAERLYDTPPPLSSVESLYETAVRGMLAFVNALPDEQQSVMVIAHNPTLPYFAEYLLGELPGGDFQPLTIVGITLTVAHWAEVSQHTGSLLFHYQPEA